MQTSRALSQGRLRLKYYKKHTIALREGIKQFICNIHEDIVLLVLFSLILTRRLYSSISLHSIRIPHLAFPLDALREAMAKQTGKETGNIEVDETMGTFGEENDP